jgi:hypothetical protein
MGRAETSDLPQLESVRLPSAFYFGDRVQKGESGWGAISRKTLVVPTMGLSTDGYVPNGEDVRVIDTGSGKACFEWYGKEKLLPPFGDHADVDLSIRLDDSLPL